MPTTREDYYAILEVPQNASPEEIKRAFRKKAILFHPDRGGSPARMKALNEAYDVLSDPQRRGEYDTERAIAQRPATAPRAQTAHHQPSRPIHPTGISTLFSLIFRPLAFALGRIVGALLRMIGRK